MQYEEDGVRMRKRGPVSYQVQSNIRAIGIAEEWKATALRTEMWVETVTECGRRFIAVWRKEEVDAARHCQEERETTRLEKLLSYTEA